MIPSALHVTRLPYKTIKDATSAELLASNIDIPHDALADFCQRNHIRKLSFFGSVLREDFGSESDVDILIEFELEAQSGLFELVVMRDELSLLLRRNVDLLTSGFLSKHFRQQVLDTAQLEYEKK